MKSAIVFVCVISLAFCKPPPQQQQQPKPFDLQEVAKQAETAIGDLHTKFLEVVGVKNNDELLNLVQEQGKTYAGKVQELVNQLGTEAGKAGESFNGIVKKLEESVADLKNSEISGDYKKLQEQFETRLQNIVKETEQFGTKLNAEGKEISGNVEEVLKKIYDNTVETAKKVASEIESKVAEQKKN